MNSTYSLVIDALFGFSFKPPVRPEFIDIINNLVNCSVPICSVDIPSGKTTSLPSCNQKSF